MAQDVVSDSRELTHQGQLRFQASEQRFADLSEVFFGPVARIFESFPEFAAERHKHEHLLRIQKQAYFHDEVNWQLIQQLNSLLLEDLWFLLFVCLSELLLREF